MDWRIQEFREGVYFVWLKSEKDQKQMLERGEALAGEEKFYLEEYVFRKIYEEREVLKRKRETVAAKKRLEDLEGEKRERMEK